MGTSHIRSFMHQSEQKKDIQVVAVSDSYTSRKEEARTVAKLSEKDVHHDHRELLARRDVDTIVIATPDHWQRAEVSGSLKSTAGALSSACAASDFDRLGSFFSRKLRR